MTTPTNLETLFLQLINEARANAGVKALAFDGELLDSSDAHSAWDGLLDVLAYRRERLQRRRPHDVGRLWMAGLGREHRHVSGGMTEATVRQLHTNLMNSPGHYANIVNGSLKRSGSGSRKARSTATRSCS